MSFDRFIMFGLNTAIRVSIPFDQGNVFRREQCKHSHAQQRLNPFRSGQCLSTKCGSIH